MPGPRKKRIPFSAISFAAALSAAVLMLNAGRVFSQESQESKTPEVEEQNVPEQKAPEKKATAQKASATKPAEGKITEENIIEQAAPRVKITATPSPKETPAAKGSAEQKPTPTPDKTSERKAFSKKTPAVATPASKATQTPKATKTKPAEAKGSPAAKPPAPKGSPAPSTKTPATAAQSVPGTPNVGAQEPVSSTPSATAGQEAAVQETPVAATPVPTAPALQSMSEILGYARTLGAFVTEEGMVNYAALKEQRVELDNYIKAIANENPDDIAKLAENDRLAFWINVYNSLTLQAVLDNYPIQARLFPSLLYPKNSIRQIADVWSKKTHTVAGKVMSLNDIEDNILRKEFSRPAVHMALSCGAKGCPRLRNEPYEGRRLTDQLNDQTSCFLHDSKNFRIDRESRTVYFSPLFEWFSSDFVAVLPTRSGFEGYGRKERAILSFAAAHLPDADKDFLTKHNIQVEFLEYDWSLNEP